MADSVLYELTDGLAVVTINRPEAMNALDTPTKVALRDAMAAAKEDPAVRAVLLTGAGDRAFCVGQDLKEHLGGLAAAKQSGTAPLSTVREHYNPTATAIATSRASRWSRRSTASRRARARASPGPATSGSWPTTAASTPRSPEWR